MEKISKPLFPPVYLAVGYFIAVEWAIKFGGEIDFHSLPVLTCTSEPPMIGRDAAPFLLRHAPLKFGAKHCVREGADRRDYVRDKPGERTYVVFTVVENFPLLLRSE